jgi:hypothetical protein
LFSLSSEYIYNFAQVAEASMAGITHTDETRAKISLAKSGENNPMLGKSPVNAFPAGVNNPMYGKTHTDPPARAKISAANQG